MIPPDPHQMVDPGSFPALVLNADFRPLSYYPLSTCSWQEAVKAIFRDSVTVLAEYDQQVHSPSLTIKLPSVLVLKDYVQAAQSPAFTRFNLFLRDRWTCQYCGHGFKTPDLTFDHVVPRSRGGKTSWNNIVAACRPCNSKKGRRLPHECNMYPRHEPYRPDIHALQEQGRKFPPRFLHETWVDFLYWDAELEA